MLIFRVFFPAVWTPAPAAGHQPCLRGQLQDLTSLFGPCGGAGSIPQPPTGALGALRGSDRLAPAPMRRCLSQHPWVTAPGASWSSRAVPHPQLLQHEPAPSAQRIPKANPALNSSGCWTSPSPEEASRCWWCPPRCIVPTLSPRRKDRPCGRARPSLCSPISDPCPNSCPQLTLLAQGAVLGQQLCCGCVRCPALGLGTWGPLLPRRLEASWVSGCPNCRMRPSCKPWEL